MKGKKSREENFLLQIYKPPFKKIECQKTKTKKIVKAHKKLWGHRHTLDYQDLTSKRFWINQFLNTFFFNKSFLIVFREGGNLIRRYKIKISTINRLNTSTFNQPANGTVWMSFFDGCGAVLYMYLNNWSTWLRGMPPPRSEIFTQISSLPKTIVTWIGGIESLSWCVSMTALIEFLNNSNSMW